MKKYNHSPKSFTADCISKEPTLSRAFSSNAPIANPPPGPQPSLATIQKETNTKKANVALPAPVVQVPKETGNDERLGPLIKCLDVVEIVWGRCRDPETYTPDGKGKGEDEVSVYAHYYTMKNVITNVSYTHKTQTKQWCIDRLIDWMPRLSEEFPFLPVRRIVFPSDGFASEVSSQSSLVLPFLLHDANARSSSHRMTINTESPKKLQVISYFNNHT